MLKGTIDLVAPVVRKVLDINCYPLNNSTSFACVYLLDTVIYPVDSAICLLNNQGHCSKLQLQDLVYTRSCMSTMESALIDLYDEHFKIMFIEINYILQQKVTVLMYSK